MDVFNFSKQTVADTDVKIFTVPSGSSYYIKNMTISGQNTGGAITITFSTGLKLHPTISPQNAISMDDERCLPAGGSVTINSPHDGIVVEVNGLIV